LLLLVMKVTMISLDYRDGDDDNDDYVCVSCGRLQAAYNVSQFAEHSAGLRRCRPSTVHVLAGSI